MITEQVTKMIERWSIPSKLLSNGKENWVPLRCTFEPLGRVELDLYGYPVNIHRSRSATREYWDRYQQVALKDFPLNLPPDLKEFWSICNGARLFEDTEYGQSGLVILSPGEALALTQAEKRDRPRDFKFKELIIGCFLGDSDLLMISCDETDEKYGSIWVCLPIDKRELWPCIAVSLDSFLSEFFQQDGSKYWG
jgi:hypothetical protein